MKTIFINAVAFLVAVLVSTTAVAQVDMSFLKDVEGCQDHSLATRMRDFIIVMCTEKTAPGPVLLDVNGTGDIMKMKTVGTRRTEHHYWYMSKHVGPNGELYWPTNQQVIEHFEKTNLLKNAQRVLLFKEETAHGSRGAIYKNKINGITYWVVLLFGIGPEGAGNYSIKDSGHSLLVISVNEK